MWCLGRRQGITEKVFFISSYSVWSIKSWKYWWNWHHSSWQGNIKGSYSWLSPSLHHRWPWENCASGKTQSKDNRTDTCQGTFEHFLHCISKLLPKKEIYCIFLVLVTPLLLLALIMLKDCLSVIVNLCI